MSNGMTKPVSATSCTECLLGRMKEKPHNTPSRRGVYPLEYIPQLHGCRYWVTFLDHATQLSTVIPITTKSKMFDKLRKFLVTYKRPKRRCYCIRLDDAEKIQTTGSAERRIVIEVTTTEQHQQNGAAEALNQAIMDKLHPNLLSAHLQKNWWPEIPLTVN